MSSFEPEPAPNEPPALRLWRTLGGYIEAAFSLFGAPATLAAKLWLTRAEHVRASAWIRMLEQFLRRLLYLDACALSLTPATIVERKARRKLLMPARFGAAFDPENPESWRASFALTAKAGGARSRGNGQGPAEAPIAALALRLEAVLRAFNDPEPYAQRLANLMARDRARAADIARDCATPPARADARYGGRELEHAAWLCAGARPALACPDSS